jgi:hypothetical protein
MAFEGMDSEEYQTSETKLNPVPRLVDDRFLRGDDPRDDTYDPSPLVPDQPVRVRNVGENEWMYGLCVDPSCWPRLEISVPSFTEACVFDKVRPVYLKGRWKVGDRVLCKNFDDTDWQLCAISGFTAVPRTLHVRAREGDGVIIIPSVVRADPLPKSESWTVEKGQQVLCRESGDDVWRSIETVETVNRKLAELKNVRYDGPFRIRNASQDPEARYAEVRGNGRILRCLHGEVSDQLRQDPPMYLSFPAPGDPILYQTEDSNSSWKKDHSLEGVLLRVGLAVEIPHVLVDGAIGANVFEFGEVRAAPPEEFESYVFDWQKMSRETPVMRHGEYNGGPYTAHMDRLNKIWLGDRDCPGTRYAIGHSSNGYLR